MYAAINDHVHNNKLRDWFAARAQDRTINPQQPDQSSQAIIPTAGPSLDQPPTQPRQEESEPAERDTFRAQETSGNENEIQAPVVQAEVARADEVASVSRKAPGILQGAQAVCFFVLPILY